MSDIVCVALITAVSTLSAAIAAQACAALFAERREDRFRQLTFTEQQVEKLYSPLKALIDEFQALDEVTACLEAEAIDKGVKDSDFDSMLNHNKSRNERQKNLLRQMKEIFQANIFYAEDSTQALFKEFVKGVERSEQLLEGAMPPALMKSNQVNRKNFYDDILGQLQKKRTTMRTVHFDKFAITESTSHKKIEDKSD